MGGFGSGWAWVLALVIVVLLIRLAAGGQLVQLYDYITAPTTKPDTTK